MRDILAAVINAIPSHKESPKSVSVIAQDVAQKFGITAPEAEAATCAGIELMTLFGVLHAESEGIRLSGQIPHYFRNSLVWYLLNQHSIASNWERSGTAKEVTISNLLDQAPYLLKAMEQRREKLFEEHKLPIEVSRTQACSVMLIKTTYKGEPYFLHQWDQKSERYQLIGGKNRVSENSLETAKREFFEEIANPDLIYGKDLKIEQCIHEIVDEYEVSRTYGALTHYSLSVFHVKFLSEKKLELSESDRWISFTEMKNGLTFAGRSLPTIGAVLGKKFAHIIQGLEDTINIKRKSEFLNYLEIKPGLFGIKLDVGKILKEKGIGK